MQQGWSKEKENDQPIILIPRTSIPNAIKKLKALTRRKAKGNIKNLQNYTGSFVHYARWTSPNTGEEDEQCSQESR